MTQKFKVGDKVTVKSDTLRHHGQTFEKGVPGEVVEAGPNGYGVKLAAWNKVVHQVNPESGQPSHRYENPAKPGEFRDHEADVLGCVPEEALGAAHAEKSHAEKPHPHTESHSRR